jgi:hypothetical protein
MQSSSTKIYGLASFTLIDAQSNQAIQAHDPLKEGAVVDRKRLGTLMLNLRANPHA